MIVECPPRLGMRSGIPCLTVVMPFCNVGFAVKDAEYGLCGYDNALEGGTADGVFSLTCIFSDNLRSADAESVGDLCARVPRLSL